MPNQTICDWTRRVPLHVPPERQGGLYTLFAARKPAFSMIEGDLMQRSGRYVSVGLLLLFGTVLVGQSGPAMPPEAERQLAREIYKEMVEIKSGYTTGATTPVAEAAARRLKAAGFPDADIFVGGAIPTKANLVVRYRGTGRAPSAAAARAYRRRRSQARRLEHGSVHAHRARRLFLRPRHRRRQGPGGGLDRQPHSLQA